MALENITIKKAKEIEGRVRACLKGSDLEVSRRLLYLSFVCKDVVIATFHMKHFDPIVTMDAVRNYKFLFSSARDNIKELESLSSTP